MSKVIMSRKYMSTKGKEAIRQVLNHSWNVEAYTKNLCIKLQTDYLKARAELICAIDQFAHDHGTTMMVVCAAVYPILDTCGIDVLIGVESWVSLPGNGGEKPSEDIIVSDEVILLAVAVELASIKLEAAKLRRSQSVAIRNTLVNAKLLKPKRSAI